MSNTTANILGVTLLFIMMFIVILANINREERADWRTSPQRAAEADMVAKWVERHKQPVKMETNPDVIYTIFEISEADVHNRTGIKLHEHPKPTKYVDYARNVAKPVDLWGTK